MIKTTSDESLDVRGGGGAPIRDSNGNFVAAVNGKLSHEEMVSTRVDILSIVSGTIRPSLIALEITLFIFDLE